MWAYEASYNKHFIKIIWYCSTKIITKRTILYNYSLLKRLMLVFIDQIKVQNIYIGWRCSQRFVNKIIWSINPGIDWYQKATIVLLFYLILIPLLYDFMWYQKKTWISERILIPQFFIKHHNSNFYMTLLFNIFLFHISSEFDFFIGVDMAMCHALICVKETHQSVTW